MERVYRNSRRASRSRSIAIPASAFRCTVGFFRCSLNGIRFLWPIGPVRSHRCGGTVDAHEKGQEGDGIHGEGICSAKVRVASRTAPYHVDGMTLF
jgi:hypothetical protein